MAQVHLMRPLPCQTVTSANVVVDKKHNDTDSEASLRTFLEGLNEIAESQRQSTLNRANDRQHERQLQT
jgi:hypothetical protein